MRVPFLSRHATRGVGVCAPTVPCSPYPFPVQETRGRVYCASCARRGASLQATLELLELRCECTGVAYGNKGPGIGCLPLTRLVRSRGSFVLLSGV